MEEDFGGAAGYTPHSGGAGGGSGVWGRRSAVKGLLNQPESRRVVAFFAVFAAFGLLQFLHAYLSGSLALMALSFHTVFNAVNLSLTLLAMLCARLSPTPSYTYGYQRYEVVAGFVNSACHSWEVALVGLVSVGLNLVCLVSFQPLRRLTTLESPSEAEDQSWAVMSTIAVTVATLVVPFLLKWGLAMGDMVVAVFTAVVLLTVATPFARHTGKVLLQTTPNVIKDRLGKSLSEAAMYEGVLECRKEHFWALSPNEYVGSFFLRVKQDTDEQLVLAKVTNLFSGFVKHLTIQIEKEESYFQ
ncbi:cation diffusion facilitator family transporter superfamily protein [Acanthamoeba castellanii str. Neff]|uniref:Cation diffusion facilitator family transporter superfamily protein n=1 Tax=Acanthamoeba castellanii (strain ATCC 30010 / Neff) TaxID=1257118 RepID=L8GNP6_ACACF|nr:cation diffusion facilitator family transporter superfamily protein [Acanthamoeba castellanii str. Neff]ELR14459.1 cation diffusion facilitator family transporter superfamily protein [Acanthamoeba castellanii str. Neff]